MPAQLSTPNIGNSAETPLIELRNVSKVYAGGDTAPVTILDNVNLSVREGEMLALLGQSGSGKSTILRLLSGLTAPSTGTVLSHGTQLRGTNRDLSIVFQGFALFPWLTVEENVRVGLIQRRLGKQEENQEIEKALAIIGLSGFENAYPKELSGGMRQRVGFARAIVAKPEILCMDEAFSALDVLTAETLRAEVVQLWQNAKETGIRSIFFVTHNISEAAYMASRIVIISSHPGRIKNVIENPLPYPRDSKSPEFAALVDKIHDAITALALPDEPEMEAATTADIEQPIEVTTNVAKAAGDRPTRIEPIPNVPIGKIVGLLETLQKNEEIINLYELSSMIGTDFGDTIAIVKAAEMLDLVDTPKHDVELTKLGWYFLAAPVPARKAIFKTQIMQLSLFQIIELHLRESEDNRILEDDILQELAMLLPYDKPERIFSAIVDWGRFAEIIDYDQRTGTIYQQEQEPSDQG